MKNLFFKVTDKLLRAFKVYDILFATLSNSIEFENSVKEYYQRQEEHRRAHVLDRRV